MRPVAITSGRHPFELAFLLAATVVGVLLLVTGHRPRSAQEMPALIQLVWPVVLVAGGVITLTGVWWRALEMGLRIEGAGVTLLGGALGMYAVALVAVSGWQAAAAAGFTGAFAVGSWWRAVQIHRDLSRLDAARKAGQLVSVPLLVEEP